MTSKSKARSRLSGRMLPIMHRDAAGIDIGAEELRLRPAHPSAAISRTPSLVL